MVCRIAICDEHLSQFIMLSDDLDLAHGLRSPEASTPWATPRRSSATPSGSRTPPSILALSWGGHRPRQSLAAQLMHEISMFYP